MTDLNSLLARLADTKIRRDKELATNGKTDKYHRLHEQWLDLLSQVGKETERKTR